MEANAAAMRQDTGLEPRPPEVRPLPPEAAAPETEAEDDLFSPEVLHTLDTVLDWLERPLRLRLLGDRGPVSARLEQYLEALARRTPRLTLVRAEVYDVQHFPALKERFQVMSVPCLVIDDRQVFFGKKSLPQLLELLGV